MKKLIVHGTRILLSTVLVGLVYRESGPWTALSIALMMLAIESAGILLRRLVAAVGAMSESYIEYVKKDLERMSRR